MTTAITSLLVAPPASASHFDSISTSTFSRPTAAGTAEAAASGDGTGAFELTAEFDDPSFAIDDAAPAADAQVLVTKTFELAPGVYSVSTTLEDLAGSATAMGDARSAALFTIHASCPSWCWSLEDNGGGFLDSNDGPQTRAASDATVEERFTVLQPSTVEVRVWVYAWAGGGSQIGGSGDLASLAVHGPGSAAIEVTGTIAALSVNPAVLW